MSASVYVIHEAGRLYTVKIGWTTDIALRLCALQTGNHRTLVVAHARECSNEAEACAIEGEIHRAFADDHVSGEWYRISVDRAIKAVSAQQLPVGTIASRIIAKCGGHAAVASMVNLDISRIHRWTYPKERGGTGGLIPTKHMHVLLAKAQSAGIDIAPADFFPSISEAKSA